MVLTQTASIGQSAIRCAIHLADNYIEYRNVDSNKELDIEKTGCNRCSLRESGMCDNCLLKVYKNVKKVYINEKARYGKRLPLNRNAILLFLLLHYIKPDKNGNIKNFDVADAAAYLHCTERTVRNNLATLETQEYITLEKTEIPGYFHIHICGYKNYFKKANEGGTGYVTFTEPLLQTLVAQKRLNALRLTIRTILYTMEDEQKGTVFERSYIDMRRGLPKYITNKDIRNILDSEQFRVVFNVSSRKKHVVFMQINKEFNQFHVREFISNAAYKEIEKFILKFNDESIKSEMPVFEIDQVQMKDIADICTMYPVETVIESIRNIYDIYILNQIEIQNLGALVRTFAKEISCSFDYGFSSLTA